MAVEVSVRARAEDMCRSVHGVAMKDVSLFERHMLLAAAMLERAES